MSVVDNQREGNHGVGNGKIEKQQNNARYRNESGLVIGRGVWLELKLCIRLQEIRQEKQISCSLGETYNRCPITKLTGSGNELIEESALRGVRRVSLRDTVLKRQIGSQETGQSQTLRGFTLTEKGRLEADYRQVFEFRQVKIDSVLSGPQTQPTALPMGYTPSMPCWTICE